MKSNLFFLFLFFTVVAFRAQLINCPNNSVFLQIGTQIIEQPLPLPAASNTVLSNLPTGANGLAIGPSFGFTAPNPTFWTTAGGTYWYYSGLQWVNTNHTTGNTMALNIGAGGTCMYNLVGGTGQIYVYNGTGNGAYLTTVSGFAGGGPYDISADANDNFYLVKAINPNPSLVIYNPQGNPICSYSLSNLPALSSGGGFAIINDILAVYNNGLSFGKINATSTLISFTAQPSNMAPSDFANCVMPVPTGLILAPSGATLNCYNSTLPLIAQVIPGGIGMSLGPPSSALVSGTYSWTGPGIIAGQGTPSVTVNLPGVYSFTVYSNGCPAQKIVQSYTITDGGLTITPVVTAPTCFSGNTVICVSPNTLTNNIIWSGPGVSSSVNSSTFGIAAPGIYSVSITNSLGCSGSETVNILAPPSLTSLLSSNTVCAQNLNNSPAAFTLTPFGALNYTLIPGPNCAYNSQVFPWTVYASGITQSIVSVVTATIIGSDGICSASSVVTFSVLPNPTVAIAPLLSGVCSGFSGSLTATGAASFNWLPAVGLNTLTGSNVVVNCLASTIFSVYGSNGGCNSSTQTSTLNILPIPAVSPSLLSSTICAGSNINLTASGSASSYSWTSNLNTATVISANLNTNPSSSAIYTLKGSLNSCTNSATATITTVSPPNVSMALSANTLCALPINGSLNSINVNVSGASTYTMLQGSNYSAGTLVGNTVPIIANLPFQSLGNTIATATLIGSNGYCEVSATRTFVIYANPTIIIASPSAVICPGASKLIIANGATNYVWSQNSTGLNIYSGSNVIASPAVTTLYSVMGESMGCWGSAQVSLITVSPLPDIRIVIPSPTLCSGSQAILRVAGNASSFQWSPANGLAASNSVSVAVSPTVSQSYSVVASLNGCTTNAVATISVIAAPLISASASAFTVCSGSTIQLSANGANSYNWFPKTGSNSTYGQNIFANPGSTTTFTVLGFNGICTGTATVPITMVPQPAITTECQNHMLCAGSNVAISVQGAENFAWFPSVNLSASSGPFIVARPLATTNYTIIGTNSIGSVNCSQQVNYKITVLPVAKAVVGENRIVCEGESIALSASGGNSYLWKPAGKLNKPNGSVVIVHPTVTTVYTVEASYDGNCAATNTLLVTVSPKPVVFAGRDTSFNADEPMSLNASGNGTLSWTYGEGIVCNTCAQTKVLAVANSCYRVEAINEAGCKATDDVCINITRDYSVYFPNSFTPNNDGLNDVFLISGEGISHLKMDIYSRWGEHIFSSQDKSIGWDGKFKGNDCAEGVYTYRITYRGLNGKNFEKTGSVTVLR